MAKIAQLAVNLESKPGAAQGTVNLPLSEFGCSVAAVLSERLSIAESQYRVAAKHAIERLAQPTLGLDCLITGALRMQEEGLECGGLGISDGMVEVIDLDATWFKDLPA